MLELRPLRSEEDYRAAMAEIDRLWGADVGSPEGDRLDILTMLVERYERNRWPIDPVDPIDVVAFFMEQNNYGPGDLARIIGSASRVSEILQRKRALTLDMIRKLSTQWGIPSDLLVRSYELRERAA